MTDRSAGSPAPAGLTAPAEVIALARRRLAARNSGDFAAADALRDKIAAAGWRVADGPEGFTLTVRPPYDVVMHVLTDVSTIFTGDAVTPLLAALDDPSVVGAGWRGVRVSDDWRSFDDAGPGEVEALLGYCFALRRTALLRAPPHPKARFYRNADLELSYAIRAAGLGRLVVPTADLLLRQGRHRGYSDTDPAYRDAESRRNYTRFLGRFRGRDDLRIG